jgi:hypothetical protein
MFFSSTLLNLEVVEAAVREEGQQDERACRQEAPQRTIYRVATLVGVLASFAGGEQRGGGGGVDINCTMMELWKNFGKLLFYLIKRLAKARWRNLESARKGTVIFF